MQCDTMKYNTALQCNTMKDNTVSHCFVESNTFEIPANQINNKKDLNKMKQYRMECNENKNASIFASYSDCE